ncbi:MAG: hypothetical protein GY696_31435 [Gammaproteobacteria bacterium]|nr:hypothetical protein [Gammaproteobacteria bacterium]
MKAQERDGVKETSWCPPWIKTYLTITLIILVSRTAVNFTVDSLGGSNSSVLFVGSVALSPSIAEPDSTFAVVAE